MKILAINGSPRKDGNTAKLLKEITKDHVDVDLDYFDLNDLKIKDCQSCYFCKKNDACAVKDDMQKLYKKLREADAIVLGSPVYFGSMTSQCKAFLERCIALRSPEFVLSNKVGGVVAVGGARNGGQELTIQGIQAALMCHEMLIVGDGKPSAHRGATVWNQKDDISQDDFGLGTLRNLGRRVGEVALQMTAGK